MNRCSIEVLSENAGESFVSIKNTNDPSELVINPRGLPQIDWKAQFTGFGRANRKWFEAVCAECALCSPDIVRDAIEIVNDDVREGFRVYRHGFQTEQIELPLYQSEERALYRRPPDENGRRTRVCCADDANIRWIGLFAGANVDVLSIRVNPNVPCSPTEENALIEKIVAWGPDWYVGDKGMGYVNGLRIIERLKLERIHTIMLTGEIQTDVTRRTADVFLTKPVSERVLFETIGIPYNA